jgi:hypothetical protein
LNKTLEFDLLRCKLRLKRYKQFNWARYFLQIFVLQLVLIFIWVLLFPGDFNTYEPFEFLGIILLVILFVCTVLTPIITFWYKYRIKVVERLMNNLLIQIKEIEDSENNENSVDNIDKD